MAKEKTFYDQMLEKKAEVLEVADQVQAEIQRAESRISEIETQKAEALRSKDMKFFTDLCAEKTSLQEYISGNRSYLDTMTYTYPVQKISQEWKLEKSRTEARVKKEVEPALIKTAKDLYKILKVLEGERTSLNRKCRDFEACIEMDPNYPLGISPVGYREFVFIYTIHQFLKSLDLINDTGNWIGN